MERDATWALDSLDEDFVQVSISGATVSSAHRALDSQQMDATVSIDSSGGEYELQMLCRGWPSRVLAAMLERILLPSTEVFASNLSEEQWEWIAETAIHALDSDLGWTVYAAALRCLRVWHVHALSTDCLPRLWKRIAADLAVVLWLTCSRLADACRLALERVPTTRMEAPLALDAQDALGYLLDAACSDMERALSTTNAPSRSSLARSWSRMTRNLWTASNTTTLNASIREAVAPFWCLRWLPFLLAVGSDELRSAVMQLLAARWDALEAWIAETALFSSQLVHEQELVPRQATRDDRHLDPNLGLTRTPLEVQALGSTTSSSVRPESEPQSICQESVAEPDSVAESEAFADPQPTSGGPVPAAAPNDENVDGCSTKNESEDFNETVEDISKDQLSSLIAVSCQHDELIRQCCETLLALTASFPSNPPAKEETLQPTMVYFGSWLILMRLHVSGRHLTPSLTPLATRLPAELLKEALQKLLDGLATRWIRYVPIQPTLSLERVSVDAAESAGFREQLETLLAGLSERLVASDAEPEWLDSALFWEPTDWRPAALGARLLLLVLLIQPLQAQRWFTDHVADRSITQPVETLTRNLVTPYLIARELEAIRRYAAKQNSLVAGREAESTRGLLSVQGSVAAREILALYHFEDVQLPVCLRLADAYPWRPTELTTADERPGTKATNADRDSRNLTSFQARYRRLFIHMTRILQQGIDERVLDTDTPSEAPPFGPSCYFGRSALVACMMYWHRRLVALLSEAPECPICYHVLHMRTGQVSRVRCPTCRHRFHAACLYRWFSSATHGATCPMCRSPF
ncbi:hypothetical protein F1559_003791 [Cyanidiococcus yangmingshanensis]|uniref:E3 ubiquitin-protein ligase listerin n=1 Tax=Cyanidiococcus yangmingshanensis TaxID=2690220 RepID=A0A7J7IJV7_9RHOD|nr:hypothetical protein F1559_003791 [Cyanidiococcus yangmingshanensis]